MTTPCRWPGCDQPAGWRGHCHRHYHKLYYTGRIRAGYAPIEPVRDRIHDHLTRGRTLHSLMAVCGVDEQVLTAILRGTQTRIRLHTADRIMSAPLRASSIGCVRRVHALRRLGWPLPEIARHAGVSYGGLKDATSHHQFTDRMADAVCRAYDTLSGTPGPSTVAAKKAAGEGCAPPAAWDDIDDPAAQPVGMAPVTTMAPKVRRCAHPRCRAAFRPVNSRHRYCSTACAEDAKTTRRSARRKGVAA